MKTDISHDKTHPAVSHLPLMQHCRTHFLIFYWGCLAATAVLQSPLKHITVRSVRTMVFSLQYRGLLQLDTDQCSPGDGTSGRAEWGVWREAAPGLQCTGELTAPTAILGVHAKANVAWRFHAHTPAGASPLSCVFLGWSSCGVTGTPKWWML